MIFADEHMRRDGLLEHAYFGVLQGVPRIYAYTMAILPKIFLEQCLAQTHDELLRLSLNLRRLKEISGYAMNQICPLENAECPPTGNCERNLYTIVSRVIHHQDIFPDVREVEGHFPNGTGYRIAGANVISNRGEIYFNFEGFCIAAYHYGFNSKFVDLVKKFAGQESK